MDARARCALCDRGRHDPVSRILVTRLDEAPTPAAAVGLSFSAQEAASPTWPRAAAAHVGPAPRRRRRLARWCCRACREDGRTLMAARQAAADPAHRAPPRGLRDPPHQGLVGLGGFAVATLGSWWHGVPLTDALFRGVLGGVAGYFVGGFAGVIVWRNLLQSEARLAVARAAELRRRELERLQSAD